MTVIKILFLTGFFSMQAQEATLSGTITDTLNTPLQNANVLAIPASKDAQIKFSITNSEGAYKLNLKKDLTYSLEVSYLGYFSFKDSIQLQEDSVKDINLTPSNQTLEEIILTERTPIKVREDTITYRPEKFLTGEERKLRDVLKKLPGIEVDREGNVQVNGKDVTKLLVDGKEFFTGDEKLGVNNIPADAVDEIVALDNYNEVAFLKGLSDSEQLALNIKLKEGKKEFAFGEVEAGGGIEDRYTVHPTLFYYSPKTSVNAIGDFNNTGQKAFTTQDYLNFEGGFSRLTEDPSAYFRLFNDEFSQFLSQRDFVFNRNNFGAVSLNQKINKRLDLSAYSILSGGTLETEQRSNLTYITDGALNESRTTRQDNQANFTLNKATLRYIDDNDLDIKYEAFLKTNSGQGNTTLNSATETDTTFVNQNTRPSALDFTQKISANKRFSRKHTTSINSSYKYLNSDGINRWNFNQGIFTGIIPLDTSQETILLNQTRTNRVNDFKFNAKHYWVLHRFHHIYPEAGINTLRQDYTSLDTQMTNDGSIDFTDSGFNNEINFNLTESYFGLQYKAKSGKFIFKPGLFVHYYDWQVTQFQENLRDTGKGILLPQLSIDWELNSAHKVKLRYNRLSQFGEASQYANRLRLQNFNSLFTGSATLENEIYNRVSLTYSKFSLFKGTFFNANLNYSHREQSIRNATTIDGIDQINTLIYTALPENTYSGSASITKLLGKVRLGLRANTSLSNYSREINTSIEDFSSLNYGYSTELDTRFKNAPNVKLGWRHNISDFRGTTVSNNFQNITPFIELEYRFFKDFVATADYNFTYFENEGQNTINRFSIGNAALLYNKEDSPWTITLEATNVFDTRSTNQSSFSQFIISDSQTFIQPRIVLLKLGYSF